MTFTGIVGIATGRHVHSFILPVPTDVNSVQLSLDGGINGLTQRADARRRLGMARQIWSKIRSTLTVKATDVAGNTAAERSGTS